MPFRNLGRNRPKLNRGARYSPARSPAGAIPPGRALTPLGRDKISLNAAVVVAHNHRPRKLLGGIHVGATSNRKAMSGEPDSAGRIQFGVILNEIVSAVVVRDSNLPCRASARRPRSRVLRSAGTPARTIARHWPVERSTSPTVPIAARSR